MALPGRDGFRLFGVISPERKPVVHNANTGQRTEIAAGAAAVAKEKYRDDNGNGVKRNGGCFFCFLWVEIVMNDELRYGDELLLELECGTVFFGKTGGNAYCGWEDWWN